MIIPKDEDQFNVQQAFQDFYQSLVSLHRRTLSLEATYLYHQLPNKDTETTLILLLQEIRQHMDRITLRLEELEDL